MVSAFNKACLHLSNALDDPFHNCVSIERPDIKSQFNTVLYQLLLDPSERVCFEAILCILGKHDNAEKYALYLIFLLDLCSTSIILLHGCSCLKALLSLVPGLLFIYYRTEERAAGWYRLTREILKLPEAPSNSKDKSQKTRRPQALIKLVMRRSIKLFPLSPYFYGGA